MLGVWNRACELGAANRVCPEYSGAMLIREQDSNIGKIAEGFAGEGIIHSAVILPGFARRP